jgi:hypothetical protein
MLFAAPRGFLFFKLEFLTAQKKGIFWVKKVRQMGNREAGNRVYLANIRGISFTKDF